MTGPPLVSLRDKTQADLGLQPGDTIELTLFGESIEVTVSNFARLPVPERAQFPGDASPRDVGRLPRHQPRDHQDRGGEEKNIERALARRYPDMTFIPVGDALNQAASRSSASCRRAVNIVGGLAVVNGLLVLAGTMAAGRKQREADAVVNKVLGSTRRDVVRVFALEYALLAPSRRCSRRVSASPAPIGIMRAARDGSRLHGRSGAWSSA